MKLSLIALTAAALASSVMAVSNAFISPGPDDVLTAGQPFVVKWNATDGGDKVNLLLKKGDPDNLDTVLTIAKDLDNGGAVRWAVPSNLAAGDDYALEIQNADSTDDVNYTNQFKIEGGSSAAASTTGAESTDSAASASTAAATTGANSTSAAETTSSAAVTTSADISGNVTTAASTTSAASSVVTSAGNLTSTGHGKHTKTSAVTASGSASASGSAAESTSAGENGAGINGVNAMFVAAALGGALLAL